MTIRSHMTHSTLPILGLAMAGAMSLAVPASAAFYDVSFTNPPAAKVAHATVNLVDGFSSSGKMVVLSGIGAGTYLLILDPSAPSSDLSPLGAATYEDKVHPGVAPFLDSAELLFGNALEEVDLEGMDPGNDGYWFFGPNDLDYNQRVVGGAAISMVPEPTTFVAGALLLLPFAVSTVRTLGKGRRG